MKFLLVDDHALFRQGLLALLGRLPGAHVFLEAETCAMAFRLAVTHEDIDLVLLDLALPGMNGLDGLVRLRELCPSTPVVLLSANEGSHVIVEGMQRGAQGFVPKSFSPNVILNALQVILAGGTYVPPPSYGNRPDRADESRMLTGRQREVLALLMQNRSNKEIADTLGMRVNTVRVHVAAILRILGAENRNEAARAALASGLMAHER